jgi:hypothetical protein
MGGTLLHAREDEKRVQISVIELVDKRIYFNSKQIEYMAWT